MIRASVRAGLLGETVEHIDLPIELARTPRVLLERFASKLPKSVPIGVAIDGRLLTDGELDHDLADGQHLIFVPQTGYGYGEAIVTVLIQLAISALISYVAYILSPRPKPPGVAQDRGDESSSTYAWDGVKTNYGPGLPIPWGYGRHPVGGQAIWTDVEASRSVSGGFVDDKFRIILSLCDGHIHRVGDVAAASVDRLGVTANTFPDHVRVNGNLIPKESPGTLAWIRPGTQDQPALPAPFAGVSQTFTINGALNEANDALTFTFDDRVDIAMIGLVMTFPGGLYQQLPTGGIGSYGVTFQVWVRQLGAAWTLLPQMGTTVASIGYHAFTKRYDASAGLPTLTGPIEVKVVRLTPSGGSSVVSSCLWRDLVVLAPHTLRYPQEALLALEISAGERFQGGLPHITTRCDLSLVRVWGATNGWSPRCWDVPAAPFDFHTYAPGRNPAWCLLDFLLARWGLGRWLTEADLDLPAFRRWAIFCDQDPNPSEPWDEPAFCVDLVGDKPRPAWEWVLTFCSAGRATPVMRDGKISVVYQYRDAHSDGVVSVPAKEPVQLLSSGNCESVQATWLSKRNRPTIYQFQFLNEDDDYSQHVLPVEDIAGTLNSPSTLNEDRYHSEDVQAYGITRPGQLFREGVWRHNIQREALRQIEFTAGPWMLAAEVGDVFEFGHELLRPFGDDVGLTMQIIGGGDAVTVVVVDHHLAGSPLQMVYRDEDGKPQHVPITSYVNGTGDAGRAVAIVNFAVPCDVPIGTTCIIGLVDQLVEAYQVVSISLQKDQKRRVRAIQWTPDAYEPVAKSEFQSETDIDAPIPAAPVIDVPTTDAIPPAIIGVRLVSGDDGSNRLTWARPSTKAGALARVYIRPADLDAWVLAGETVQSDLRLSGLRVGQSYRVSICLENQDGVPVPAELGDQATVIPDEFPRQQLPQLTNVSATVIESGVRLQWDELQQREFEYVEVRAGSSWAAGAILTRERTPSVLVINPPAGVPLLVAARASSGLYGPIAVVPAPAWDPAASISVLEVDDLTTSPAGTFVDTQWDAGEHFIELAGDVMLGTYESLEQDVGYQAPFFWRVQIDRRELEAIELGALTFELGSGEARWRTLDGRPASPGVPGLDWGTKLGDLAMSIGDLPSTFLLGGNLGVVGSHTRVLVESRFYVNGAWTDYLEHVDRVVTASRMQVRLTINRRTAAYSARATKLTYEAFL